MCKNCEVGMHVLSTVPERKGEEVLQIIVFPAKKDFQWECYKLWVSHFIHEFRCNTVFEILLSYRFPQGKSFPIILGNITVACWQRLADSQNYYGFELFLCPLRIPLSKTREENVGITYSLCHFFISPPYIAVIPVKQQILQDHKMLSKCTFYFLIWPECTKFKVVQSIILGKYSSPLTHCTEVPYFSAQFLFMMTRNWCRVSVLREKPALRNWEIL